MRIVHQSESKLVLKETPYGCIISATIYFTALLSFMIYAVTVPYYFTDGWNMILLPLLFFLGAVWTSIFVFSISFTFDKDYNIVTAAIHSFWGHPKTFCVLNSIVSIRTVVQVKDYQLPDVATTRVPVLEFYAGIKDGTVIPLFFNVGGWGGDAVTQNFFMIKKKFSTAQKQKIETYRKIATFLKVPFVMQFTNAVSKIES